MRKPSTYRVGKQQVMVFLPPERIEQACEYAARHMKTRQEILAHAINTALSKMSYDPVLPEYHERLSHRHNGKSATRLGTIPSRENTRSMGGWYPNENVATLREICHKEQVTPQVLATQGLALLIETPKNTVETEILDIVDDDFV